MPDLSPDDVLRALLVRAFQTAEQLAVALRSTAEEMADVVDRLAADGLVEASAGLFRLTEDGTAVAHALIARDRADWGPAAADAAWDAFAAFDDRLIETVIAWQVRKVDGAQVPNDHADAAYDASVRAGLAALHADARAWLESCITGLPRLRTYVRRLDHAARRVAEGDGRYIASLRVDSYHGAWFEPEEDVILLGGRTRADWVAAGHA